GVVEGDAAGVSLGNGQPDGGRAAECARAHAVGPAGSRVARAFVALVRGARNAGDLGSRAVAEIGMAGARKQVQVGLVERSAAGLLIRCRWLGGAWSFIPGNAEPAQVVEHGFAGAGLDEGWVEIFDAKHQGSAERASAGCAEQERCSAAEMQGAGRGRG